MNDECTHCADVSAENDRLDDENTGIRTELEELQARYDALKNTAQNTHDNITAQRELDEATDRIKELEAEVAEWKEKYETLHALASNAYDATSHHLNALWNTL